MSVQSACAANRTLRPVALCTQNREDEISGAGTAQITGQVFVQGSWHGLPSLVQKLVI